MDSSVQRWLTGHDSLSTIKEKRSRHLSVQRWYEHNRLGVTRHRIMSFRGDELDMTARKE